MAWTNYHSHTTFCDGSHAMADYVQEAIAKGMQAYGVSGHGPLGFAPKWAIPWDQMPAYQAEFARLKTRHSDQIELYLGMEIDYIPGQSWWDQLGVHLRSLDYTIGSVHHVEAFDDGRYWEVDGEHDVFVEGLDRIFKGDIRAAISRYYELTRWMVMLENPDVVGHLDKIKLQNTGNFFFSETDQWYREEIRKTLKIIARMGCIVEVNTRGLYTGQCLDLYPSQWILEQVHAMGIPVTINSDTHSPSEVTAGYEFAARTLLKIGFRHVTCLLDGRWQEVELSTSGLLLPRKTKSA